MTAESERGLSRRDLLVVLLLLVIAFAFFWDGWLGWRPDAEPRTITPRADLTQAEKSTIKIFESASDSVVHITTVSMRRDMFSMNLFEIPRGSGSGFMWDNRGHIVTNYHVVRKGEGARVTLADQTTWDATLVGVAPAKDVAVLRIDAPRDKLKPLPVGKSMNLQVGQSVFAIGNPFGLDQSLTSGIISGLGREIESVTGRPIQDVIQTDAAINPGNSGGPLLDSAGRLIGVNTAIMSPSGTYAGIGFAVPVDTINRIVPQLIETGHVERAGLGLTFAPDGVLRRLGIEGALVLDVKEGGPADEAGIRPTRRTPRGNIMLGDVIMAINGEEVESGSDLLAKLDKFQVGEKVTLKIRRNDQEIEVGVTLEAVSSR